MELSQVQGCWLFL